MMGKKILKKLPMIVYPPFVMMGKKKWKKPIRKTESKEV